MSGYEGVLNANGQDSGKPILGREKEMKENLAGGYAFKADDWQALRRWLLCGSLTNGFYQSSFDMTTQNLEIIKRLVNENPKKVAEEILYASKKGINVQIPILGLVFLSMGNKEAKGAFKEVFGEVIRTASHLYTFFKYNKMLRGFGRLIHSSVNSWLDSHDPKELEYQFLKYQSREGWSAKDVLRIVKPVESDPIKSNLYGWIVGKSDNIDEAFERIKIYETLKQGLSESDVVDAINKYRLTWEMVPANIERTKAVWKAIFMNMPVGATIRSLGNLTEKGIFEDSEMIYTLDKRMSKENIHKAYVHPISTANAYKVYTSAGYYGKSKLSWTPNNKVSSILERVIEDSFDNVEKTNKKFMFGLDVSGSMTGFRGGGDVKSMILSPMEIEATIALATVRTEEEVFVGGFSDNYTPLPGWNKSLEWSTTLKTINSAMNYSGWRGSNGKNIVDGIWPNSFGGTNAGSTYEYAIRHKIDADVFVFFTDSENWLGYHPAEALKKYRNVMQKPEAKAIYITLLPYSDNITLVDPKDRFSYDVAGFSADTPKIISFIAKGDI